METITLADYIQYGFLAFIGLLLIALMVAMLRQVRDTGELKGEVRATNSRIDDLNKSLSDRIDATNQSLSDRIDATNQSLSDRIDATNIRIDDINRSLSDRIDATNQSLSDRIDATNQSLSDRIDATNIRIDDINRSLSDRIDALTVRIERLETTVAAQGREISEIKGLIIALHERVDLVMRHRHDPDSGQVVLTPEEVAAD